MTGHSVAFVASNDTHVDLFAPVIGQLGERGVDVLLGSLDSVYGQGAEPRASMAALPTTPVVSRPAVRVPFYSRRVTAIWADVLRSRGAVRQWLEGGDPAVVVMGNDRGLIEKLVIDAAHQQGRQVVLVQDGMLAQRPEPVGRRGRARARAKRALSPVLETLRMPYLAASEYGAGGADLVCASGPHGAARFRDLGVPGERIIVTGQPRFDHLRTLHPAPLPGVVTMFTTPFAYADLGIDRQRRQLSLAAELWQAFARVGVDFRIKPHPREDVTDYRAAIPALAVQAGGSIEALQETALAIIGMSTVTEEAGLLRVPVIVPGDVIHAGRGDDPALSRDVYPRFDDAQTAVALAMSLLRDGPLRSDVVERQAVAVAQKVHVDPDAPAAALIADAICSLMP